MLPKRKSGVQLKKASLYDYSVIKHDFGTKASLPVIQNLPAVFHNTTRFCGWVLSHHGNAFPPIVCCIYNFSVTNPLFNYLRFKLTDKITHYTEREGE